MYTEDPRFDNLNLNFYALYVFDDPSGAPTHALCIKSFFGTTVGQWLVRNFTPQPCDIPSPIIVSGCPQLTPAQKGLLIQIQGYQNYPLASRDDVIALGTAAVLERSPEILQLRESPNPQPCSSLDGVY